MFIFECGVTFHECRRQNIAHTQTVAAGFIHVGRPDALEGGTDLCFSLGGFRSGINDTMGRQDKVRPFGDHQPFLYVYTQSAQLVYLIHQDYRINHHTVADDIRHIFVKNTGRNGMQHEFFVFKFQRMACVRPTLETCNYTIRGGQHVYNLSFSLITPLQS